MFPLSLGVEASSVPTVLGSRWCVCRTCAHTEPPGCRNFRPRGTRQLGSLSRVPHRPGQGSVSSGAPWALPPGDANRRSVRLQEHGSFETNFQKISLSKLILGTIPCESLLAPLWGGSSKASGFRSCPVSCLVLGLWYRSCGHARSATATVGKQLVSVHVELVCRW